MSEPPAFPTLSQHDRTALATFVVKRFRKYHAAADAKSASSQEAPAASGSRSTFNVVQASSKAPHMPPPFDPHRYVRLAEPKHALQSSKGVGKVFPKLPPNPRPAPLEPRFSAAPHVFARLSWARQHLLLKQRLAVFLLLQFMVTACRQPPQRQTPLLSPQSRLVKCPRPSRCHAW